MQRGFAVPVRVTARRVGARGEDRFPWQWVIFTTGFKTISLSLPLSFPSGRGGPCAEGLVSVELKSIKLCWEEQGIARCSRLSACSKQHPNDIFQIFLFLNMVKKATSPVQPTFAWQDERLEIVRL